jgi:hypothetical protein
MTGPEPSTNRSSKRRRILRRILEIITGAALMVAIFSWPRTRPGLVYLYVAAIVAFVGVNLLRKWPSR